MQRGHTAKRGRARIYAQARLNPKSLLSPPPPLLSPHNRPTIMYIMTAWQNSKAFQVRNMMAFLICQKGAPWMGDPDGKMLPATRSIPPLESLVSSVYPLVALCPWSVCLSTGSLPIQCGTLSSSNLQEPMRLSMVTMCFAPQFPYL